MKGRGRKENKDSVVPDQNGEPDGLMELIIFRVFWFVDVVVVISSSLW